MPCQPFLVELDDSLGALEVGLLGRDQVSLIRTLPLDQEHQLAWKEKKSFLYITGTFGQRTRPQSVSSDTQKLCPHWLSRVSYQLHTSGAESLEASSDSPFTHHISQLLHGKHSKDLLPYNRVFLYIAQNAARKIKGY